MAKNHTPIMMTENEKREYFEDLVYLINDVESIKHRNENLTKLESFLKSNREFSKIKMFKRRGRNDKIQKNVKTKSKVTALAN